MSASCGTKALSSWSGSARRAARSSTSTRRRHSWTTCRGRGRLSASRNQPNETEPHQPKDQPEGSSKAKIRGAAPESRSISQERAKGLRAESSKPSPKHQPHPPTHYEPSGFVPEPPVVDLRAAAVRRASDRPSGRPILARLRRAEAACKEGRKGSDLRSSGGLRTPADANGALFGQRWHAKEIQQAELLHRAHPCRLPRGQRPDHPQLDQ